VRMATGHEIRKLAEVDHLLLLLSLYRISPWPVGIWPCQAGKAIRSKLAASDRMNDFGYGRTDRNYYRGGIVDVGRAASYCQQEARQQTAQP
jgi:hypothetical protein